MATPWDAVFKELFALWLKRLGVTVQTQVEVVRLPRTVDMTTMTDTVVRARLAEVTPFDYFRLHNLLEFKSPRDPLTPAEYKLILARAYLYLREVDEDDLRQATVTVVSVTRPRKVLNSVPHLVKFQEEGPGRYRSDDKLPLYALVTSELPVEERNYPLLLFTARRKRHAVLQELAARREFELLRIAYELYPRDVSEVIPVSKEFPTLEENIRFFIKDFGEKRVMQGLVDLIGLERAEEWLREAAEAQPPKRTRRSRKATNGNNRRQR